MKFILNRKSFMKFGKWSLILFLLVLFGFFVVNFISPAFASLFPGQGPYTNDTGQLVPAWVNLTRHTDMFFVNGTQVFIVANFSCSPPSVCNESMKADANFSEIGGSQVRPGVYKTNSSTGSWALFEFNDTIALTNIQMIQPKEVRINATAVNETGANVTDLRAPVLVVNMSTFGCPPADDPNVQFPVVPGFNITNNTPVPPPGILAEGCTQNTTLCLYMDTFGPGTWDDVDGKWKVCVPDFSNSATTNLTQIAESGNMSAIQGFTIEVPGKAKIVFNTNVSFASRTEAQAIMEFAMKSLMTGGKIGMNDSEWNGAGGRPNLNLSATLTIYNISQYFPIKGRPQIWRFPLHRNSTGGQMCPANICSNFVWDGQNISFTVSSFSDYGLNESINVTLQSPYNFTYINTKNVNFTYIPEWASGVTMDNCTLYGNFTGTWAANVSNETAGSSSGPLQNGIINWFNNTVNVDGAYKWNVYCYDISGQYDYDAINWTVTVDTVKPQWSNNVTSPTSPTTYSSGQSYQFNITVTDENGVSKVILEFDNTNYTDVSNVSNVYYKTLTDLPANPTGYTFKWYMNDSANNWNVSDVWVYVINKAACDVDLWLNSGTKDADASITYPTQANATATINVTGFTWNMTRNGTNVAGGTGTLTELVTLGASAYNYTGYWNGNENYTACSEQSILTVNQGTPDVKVFVDESPSNKTVTYPTTVTIKGNSTTTITPPTFNLYISTSSASGNPATIPTQQGAGTYQVVYNTSGNANWTSASNSTLYLIVSQNSSTANFINLTLGTGSTGTESNYFATYPTTTNATGWYSSSVFSGQTITFTLYRNTTFVGTSNPVSDVIVLGNGTYNYTYYTAGNVNYSSASKNYWLFVNKGILALSISGSDVTYPTSVGITTSESNSGDADVNYTLYRNTTLANFSTTLGVAPTGETILLGVGAYLYTFNSSGGANWTSNTTGVTQTITVSQGPTNIALYLNGTRGNVSTYQVGQVANFTVVLNVSGKYVNLTTNISGWVDQTNVTPLMNYTTLTTAGTYNITGYWLGDANYTSDSETWYATVVSTTTTTTTTTTVPSGGGGGAPSRPKEHKKTQTWSKITPGVAEIMHVDDPEIGLKMINITVRNPAQTVTITVIKLEGKPATVVHEISGKVYKYMEITPTNLPDENIDKVKIQFQVNKSWIAQNRIDRRTIALNRYRNGWQKLPTQEISEDSNFIYYEAESPGFSTFAITGEEIIATTVPTTTIATTIATTMPTTITIPVVPTEVGLPIWTIGIIVIIICVVVLVWVYRKTPKEKKESTE